MKKKIKRILTLLFGLFFPGIVLAEGSNIKVAVINFNAIISSGAIVNNGGPKSNNLNVVIICLVIIILVLFGAMMFSPKK